MSQQGAAARGAAGHTYEQILSFYFPGTKIVKEVEEMATNNEIKVLQWLEERIGDGYVWGAKGYTLTQSKLDELINQYPEYVSQSKNGKWLGKKVWDCAQLVRYAMKEVDISMVSGATSQWNKTDWIKKGKINTIPRDKICCLYRQTNGTTMQHTGVYLGNGYFIDARGSSTGVVKTKLEKYPWTHWGIPDGLYSKKELAEEKPATPQEVLKVLYKAKVVAESGSTVRMRSAASGSASTVKKVPVGSEVEVVAEQSEWKQIVYNGQTGFMMDDFLEKTEEAKPNEYYVKIKCASAAEAERLAKLLATATAN